MKGTVIFAFSIVLLAGSAAADQDIQSIRVAAPPKIDCLPNDPDWAQAPIVTTHNPRAGLDIDLRSVHTDESVFFLVVYPDLTENRRHKYLAWDNSLKAYRSGPMHEDSFVFKWSMEPRPVDLSISGDTPYKADVWYWKANRTDPVGYADDKHHYYGSIKMPESLPLYGRSGHVMYLTRMADEGQPAYDSQFYGRRINPEMPRYINHQPQGSRSDVRAKGCWQDNRWTIEFSRNLKTGHSDDVQFETDRTYRFGVSRFEIAGQPPNPKLEQPLYDSGEIGEHLTLHWM